MKKVFMLLAACALFAACSTTPTEKVNDYFDDMMEAVKDGDVEKARKINAEAIEWMDSLNEEDAEEAEKAVFKWLEENQEAADALKCL